MYFHDGGAQQFSSIKIANTCNPSTKQPILLNFDLIILQLEDLFIFCVTQLMPLTKLLYVYNIKIPVLTSDYCTTDLHVMVSVAYNVSDSSG